MRISVVVPTLNEAERIGALVQTLFDADFDEVIVSDGTSVDATADIARTAGALVVQGPPGRGSQLQRGAVAASGDILFFLHADSLPPPGARALIEQALAAPGTSAGCFRLVFDEKHPILSWYGAMSRINHDLFTYGDQGFFVSRIVFDQIGGYTDDPVFEDVDIIRRVRRAGRFVKLEQAMTTSARRFLQNGIIRRQLANVGLVMLYRLGVPPRQLARWYRPQGSGASG